MRCLCCGKIIKNPNKQEILSSWHDHCIKSFFQTITFPIIDLDDHILNEIANSSVNKRLTVPGVQKKISLHLSDEPQSRLTIVDYPTGYILKPVSHDDHHLPELEYLSMQLADCCHIPTVPYALLKVNNTYAYITKRIDRKIKKTIQKYAMEDFCQLSNRLTEDKYKGSYEQCAKIIINYSSRMGIDMTDLFLRLVFSFLIGNSDMHLKNFSLIETAPSNRHFILSPAYDLLPVNMILPEDLDEMALTLNGKKRNLKRGDFIKLAKNINISKKVAQNLIDLMLSYIPNMNELIDLSYLDDNEKASYKALILQRSFKLMPPQNKTNAS